MIRTQIYLKENLKDILRNLAEKEGTTLSELVRRAIRAHYLGDFDKRRQAMEAFVGIRESDEDTDITIRRLRRGSRIDRLMRA